MISLTINQLPILIEPKIHPRSRCMSLRLNLRRKVFTLTMPPFVSEKKVMEFLNKHESWLYEQQARFSEISEFSLEKPLTIFGVSYTIRRDPLRKKGVWAEETTLWVGGIPPEDIPSLIIKHLKDAAQDFFTETSILYCAQLGLKFDRISIRDASTRWGSCSSRGTLSFSWRLALTPLAVAQYVCSHEVSHLKHMNHSPSFWKLVEELCPDYKTLRKWLKQNGHTIVNIL